MKQKQNTSSEVKRESSVECRQVEIKVDDETTSKPKIVIRPPPGFPVKPTGTPLASKLLANQKNSLLRFAVSQTILKGEKNTRKYLPNKPSTTKKCLSDTMKEFSRLSSVMDRELKTYEIKLLTMNEQKEMVLEGAREQGRVGMLKTLFYEQQEAMRELESQHRNQIEDMKEQHKQQLQQFTNNKIVKPMTRSDTDLQMEFNKVLNKREDEIENLNAMVHDLQCELEVNLQGDSAADLQMQFNKVLNKREDEIENLNAMVHDLQCELEEKLRGSSTADLQIQFNRALDDREEEIENLNATIHDLQSELEVFQGGQDDIAMEVRFVCYIYFVINIR